MDHFRPAGSGIKLLLLFKWSNILNCIPVTFETYDDGSTHFSQIANSLNLFGYNNTNKFYYENNSMWGIDGKELKTSQSATQGLVARQLNKGRLEIKTDRGTVLSPYFNEDFLNGHNLKNAVLGKVYNDVSFPFISRDPRKVAQIKSMRQNIGYLTAKRGCSKQKFAA